MTCRPGGLRLGILAVFWLFERGCVDPDDVTYYIFDAFGTYYDPAIAEVKGATSYQFEFDGLENQDFVAYQVTAGYGENYSLDNLPGPETVTDNFDNPDYPAMSISGAGQWTVHDGDGGRTYNIFRELYNPYQTQPIGFQLFDRVVAQVTDYYWLDAEPHSGSAFTMPTTRLLSLSTT